MRVCVYVHVYVHACVRVDHVSSISDSSPVMWNIHNHTHTHTISLSLSPCRHWYSWPHKFLAPWACEFYLFIYFFLSSISLWITHADAHTAHTHTHNTHTKTQTHTHQHTHTQSLREWDQVQEEGKTRWRRGAAGRGKEGPRPWRKPKPLECGLPRKQRKEIRKKRRKKGDRSSSLASTHHCNAACHNCFRFRV